MFLFATVTAFSQDSVKIKNHNYKQKVKLAKELGLTKQQAKEFKQTKKATKSEIDAVKNNGTLQSKEKKEKIKAIRLKQKEKTEKGLTVEQRLKFKAIQEKKKAEHKKKRTKQVE